MEHLEEHVPAVLHQEDYPVNLTQPQVSSGERETNDFDEEKDKGQAEDHYVNHSPAFADGDYEHSYFYGSADEMPSTKLSVDVRHSSEGSQEESDYEEPKKMGEELRSVADISDETTGISQEERLDQVCNKCLKCGELINSAEKVNDVCPHFHVNCFCCTHCDTLITDENFQLIGNEPYCKNHFACSSSAGIVQGKGGIPSPKQEEVEASFHEVSQSVELGNQDLHRCSPVRSDDVLPPTGSARRLVEQWSNIEALKGNQNVTNVSLSDSPQYAPNTAKTIAAKFSAGLADDHASPKPTMSTEPTEQWPSQGQTRGLIAKFSAMHA